MARIALVVPSFPQLSETFIVSKFLGLLGRGWDVHVVCNKSSPTQWAYFPQLQERSDIRRRVHVTWPVRPRWLAGTLWLVATGRCLVEQPKQTLVYLRKGQARFGIDILRRLYLDASLVALQPDLVHFEFGALAVRRTYLNALLGCRLVVSFRGYDINYLGLEDPAYYQEIWSQADALHLLGRDLWQRAQRRGCPPDEPHFLIPPAIDTSYFDPGAVSGTNAMGTSLQPLRILSVGRLAWKKGYEYALQAVRRLCDQGVHCQYTVVGDGAVYDAIAFARYQLGLTGCVHLVGARTRAEVKAYLSQSDVFLHAAVSEGFCNAVLEAQAMKVPVVCSDADGLSENVVNGQTGFVVPRRDPYALAEKLALLAKDPSLRRYMGEKGRQRVLDHFQLDNQIEQFDQLYRSVLMEHPRRQGGLEVAASFSSVS